MSAAPQNSTLRIPALARCLALCAAALTQSVAAALPDSDLSDWLEGTVITELSELLERHPRYRDVPLAVVNSGGDALAEAIAARLRVSLAARAPLVLPGAAKPPRRASAIDELVCARPADPVLRLAVRLEPSGRAEHRLSIALQEGAAADSPAPRLWLWHGRLQRAERELAARDGQPGAADGSLEAPWTEAQVAAAAASLARELACALRPDVATRLRLAWPPQEASLHPAVRDALNDSRRRLAALAELEVTADRGDYAVEWELRPFRGAIYQLWLHARPRDSARSATQAVAYFRLPPPARPVPRVTAGTAPAAMPARDFLQVELVDAYQTERAGGSADMHLALRLQNRGQWPLRFALRFSAGHFRHCIASVEHYRHDQFGSLRGTLAAGAREVRHLVVTGLRHAPVPWIGVPRCAGSIDFDAFERYGSEGHRVTESVHWEF